MAEYSKLISLRIKKLLLADIERASEKFTADRGKGAKRVSQTETIEILITHGLHKLGIAGDEGWATLQDLADENFPAEDKKTSIRKKLKSEHGIDLGSKKKK